MFVLALFSCNTKSSNDFALCWGSVYPYYNPDLKYEGDFYAIKEHFTTNFQKVNSQPNHGVVRIRFQVNCKGQAGNYQIETYNYNFQKDSVHAAITEQLLSLTQQLQAWIPAKNKEGEEVNSHKFFAFHIKNGELIDIMPK